MGIKSWRFFYVVLLAVFALCSCTKKPYLDIAEGRFLWNRGEYSKAVASFLHGKENSREDDFTEGVAYSNYGRIRISQWAIGEREGSNHVEFTKAQSLSLPVITEINGIYSLQVEA